ncbi:hypothetical protein OURE66S_02637 [Oligella ureolytica]
MKRRHFLTVLAAAGVLAVAGCSDNHTEPFVGYWLQDSPQRPVSLHIKEDGADVIVTIGQLVFGRYETEHESGHVRQEHLLTIADGTKQLRYENDVLVDVEDSDVRFNRVTEQQYKAAADLK